MTNTGLEIFLKFFVKKYNIAKQKKVKDIGRNKN